MPEIAFDRYYRYDELTALLNAYTDEYPDLVQISSIGKSYEGRDIWLLTITNSKTGPAEEKPALWVDGNIHASEVSGSTACLYLINKLTTAYGKDDDVTRSLDTRAYYICPRMNPDGAEWALADKPKIIRSNTRPYPYDEEPLEGLEPEDIDGDGRVLMMRVADPNGPWKKAEEDTRLLIRRDPAETGGEYYRVFTEGHIENYDGISINPKPRKEGLDINRNFPGDWVQDYVQPGAGPYPASEPEVHAIVDFIARNKNITAIVAYHTYSGVLLRPFSGKADDEMPPEDLWTFQKIGDKGTELTNYPNISIFHEFKYHPKQVIHGGSIDWQFEHLGLFAWAVEIWSPQRQAGIEEYKYIDWYREHPLEDDLKMLKWSDDVLDGKGYVDWYEFEHPQLGQVELGGWDAMYAWRNPPPQFLEKEVAPLTDWMIWQLLISPRLEIFKTEVTALGDGTYHIVLAIQNTGWLPSYVTKQALSRKVVRDVVCEINLPDGIELVSGKQRHEIGQLEGRSLTSSALTVWGAATTADRAKTEWVVKAPAGTKIELVARHERAGTVRTTVTLA